MTYGDVNESTLGVVFTPNTGRRVGTAARAAGGGEGQQSAGLGTSFLGLGAALVAGLSAIYGFAWFVALWGEYPNPVPALVSWILLIMAFVGVFLATRFVSDRLPWWVFAIFLSTIAFSLALDLLAIWPLHDVGRNATSAVTAGMGLLLVITFRGAAEILIADAVIGVALIAAIAFNSPLTADDFSHQLTAVAFAVLPAAIGVVIVRGFRRMVQIELDRVLVQSTVSAPRFAVGMLASEELARLDLAAEELLDSVATGRTPLPLRPRTASTAASLATELRLHLIEGRRETWLYHAISESEMLGKSVNLIDKGSLAGLLDDSQRDGLLSAIWLLVSERKKAGVVRNLQVQVGPIAPTGVAVPGAKLLVPIEITTTGIARNRVDPSTWEAVRRVGRYSDSTRDASVKIDIDCLVDNPADV
jgi:hypothetical protein